MLSLRDVDQLLDELDHRPAHDLEGQELDFKEWNTRSTADAVNLVVDMAVCMANGGGGTTVFGVHDRRVGRAAAILGVPLRRRIMIETGETDFTAVELEGDPASLVSAVAMERLRDAARRERAPDDLLRLPDLDLLRTAGLVKPNGRLTRAGLLIAGREDALLAHVPYHAWTHFRMRSDTDYSDPLHGRAALPDAIARLEERVFTDNPITTVEVGPFHFEYRTYPEIALREALLNALAHRDYQLGGPVLLKQYPGGLDVHSPGGFIGGVSPANVLHHQPVARNPHLVEALIRLRLVNRGNLGVPRMFKAMLQDGKEPPLIAEAGEAVTVTFRAAALSAPFRAFVAEQAALGRDLSVDHLLILPWLLRHPELPLDEAARLTQRSEAFVREVLAEMEVQWGMLERGGTGRGTYWMLDPAVHRQLAAHGLPERDRRIDWEAAKTRVLSVLQQRARRGEPGLTNAEARAITHLDRRQVKRLLDQLRREGLVAVDGVRRYARWSAAEP